MKEFTICTATHEHLRYAGDVVQALKDAALTKGTGLAKRSPEYIRKKIEEGKAVIALHKDAFAGFCYIESWEHERYVATSGLIVLPEYRNQGLASAIKKEAFNLARRKFPTARMFGLTTSLAVMRINSSLGFVPVTFTELTADKEFWKGCETCSYYDVLQRSGNKNCLCTGMLFDPKTKKVVVAYSGGLDTSYTVMYLAREKGYEVYAACADTGGFTPEQLARNRENALKLGAKEYVTLDVKEEYYQKSIRYMVYGNALRNGTYPISVSSERLFQAAAIARYAKQIGAHAIAHGSTGAGNDQVRFDMTFAILCPGTEIITLTRDRKLSRQEEVSYLNAHGFPADFAKLKYSYNIGLWGTSICGGEILDSARGLPEEAYLKPVTKSGSENVRLQFEKGELVGVNGENLPPVQAIQALEKAVEGYGLGRTWVTPLSALKAASVLRPPPPCSSWRRTSTWKNSP